MVKPSHSETDLLHMFLEAVPYALPDVLVFRRSIINTISVHGFNARNGIPGQADAYVVGRGGRHLELETKASRGRLGEAQVRWRARCLALEVPHLVLRAGKGEAPGDTVARWVGEVRAAMEAGR